jgi:hypothetical protein
MRWRYKMPLRLRSLFRNQQTELELGEEIQFHLQYQIDEYVAQGMEPEEARYAALRVLGGLEQIKEECREMRNVSLIENIYQDLHYGFRMLRRNLSFSILAVLCLTIGIGANAAVFSWIEGILLRPFPAVTHQDRLLVLVGTNRTAADKGTVGSEFTDVSWPDFLDFQRNCTLIDSFIADKIMGTTLSIGDRAESTTGSVVSSNYFDALGIHPIFGRGFEPTEDSGRNAHPVTVDVERALPRRSGDYWEDAVTERCAAHYCWRSAGRVLWHLCRLANSVLGPGFDAGSIRTGRIHIGRSWRALDRGFCPTETRRNR